MADHIYKYRATLNYQDEITANKLNVALNGTNYAVTRDADGGYGNADLMSDSTAAGAPFYIVRANDINVIWVSDTIGTTAFTIVIQEDTSSVETTECFRKAVQSVGGNVMMLKVSYDEATEMDTIIGATWQEAHDAIGNGTMLFLIDTFGNISPCVSYADDTISFALTSVTGVSVATSFVDWLSTGQVDFARSDYPSQS